MKHTDIYLPTLQGKKLNLILVNHIRGGVSSVMGDRYTKSSENEKILYIDANNLHGRAMSQTLPYDEFKFDKELKLEGVMNNPDD